MPEREPQAPQSAFSDEEKAAWAARWSQPDPEGDGTRRDVQLRVLKESCRKGQAGRPTGLDLRGIRLSGEDLSGLDLSGYDLSAADLATANLSGANLGWAKLPGANLYRAKLTGTEFLRADLTAANLGESSAERAGFAAADLTGASLLDARLTNTTFSEAKLRGADLRAANLRDAAMRNADLSRADFTRAHVQGADLKQSDVKGATFELADLQNARLLGLRNYAGATWVGADIRNMDLRGAYMIRRHIADENYLFEFRTRSKFHGVLYYIWWLTSDCGRSLLRWAFWVLGVAVLYAFAYLLLDVDYRGRKTFIAPLYFSIVTLTTLGYGDIVPNSAAAQILAISEAVMGYVGLGGLLSILANKMARRAD